MLQRIQTLFIVLAFLSTTALAGFPILRIAGNSLSDSSPSEIYAFKSKGLVTNTSSNSTSLKIFIGGEPYRITNFLAWIVIEILILVALFLFRSRILQMRLIWAIIGLILVLSILIYLDINHLAAPSETRTLEPGSYALSASLLFLLMARRQIQKDENLVRSVDRLR